MNIRLKQKKKKCGKCMGLKKEGGIKMKTKLEKIYDEVAKEMNLDFKRGFLNDDFESDVSVREEELSEYSPEDIETCKMDWIHSIRDDFLYRVILKTHPDLEDIGEEEEKYYEEYYDGCFDYLVMKTFESSVITNEMLKSGLSANIVVPKLTDNGLVCYIGEHWFYFGGSEFEYTDPKEIPFETLVEEIKIALDSFKECKDYETEYLYYYFYLTENLHK